VGAQIHCLAVRRLGADSAQAKPIGRPPAHCHGREQRHPSLTPSLTRFDRATGGCEAMASPDP
jgi:hypothetical protein